MNIVSVAKNYLVWHYSMAYVDMAHIWWNYLWFVNHLFSVPDVMMSWIAPFKRLQEDKVNILMHPEEFFSGLFINIMMRIVGFFLRTAIIFMALVAFLIVIIGGGIFLLLWTGLPVIVVSLFIQGLQALIS